MLERFVFRRDDEASFPDARAAPIRASGTTSWGAAFTVAFRLESPPLVSRFYAHLPGFPDPRKQGCVAVVATHRHLFLFRVGIVMEPSRVRVQDMFVFDSSPAAAASPVKALPHCTEPEMDYRTRPNGSLRRRRRTPTSLQDDNSKPRLLALRSMGVLCGGEQEFAVAELNLFKPSRSEVYADIYLLRSSSTSSPASGGGGGGEWTSMRVPILVSDDNPADDMWQLCLWQTDTVIPFDNKYLCWVDYYRGILLCDVFAEPAPTVSFLLFPLDAFPDTHNRSKASSWLYRAATAVNDGHTLKFVDVARNDDIGYGALKKPGAGFTVTCHTLGNGMVWSKDYCTVTSDELWDANPPERLPREVLMFPQVDIDRPHVVHFLVSDYKYVMKKMWVVSVDMNTKTVESIYRYTNGLEDRGTEDADLTIQKSECPMSFLPCEFSKFLQTFSRERKDMGSGSGPC
ncbi:hypothetical protein EJB05_15245, partial [Eragrostis curvula]